MELSTLEKTTCGEDSPKIRGGSIMPIQYDIAQICLNGHVVNDSFGKYPENNSDYCRDCGAKTITNCPTCNASIRGSGYGMVVIDFDFPSYCEKCGKPFPWTDAAIKAAKDLTQELELSPEEKTSLTETIEDLVKDSPQTTVSATKFKRLVTKGGSWALDAFKDILVSVVSETAKKTMFPNS